MQLQGQPGEITGIAFSPDGTRLISSAKPATVKLWDEFTGQELLRLQDQSYGDFSPDGHLLATISVKGTIHVWDARPLTPELAVERDALGLVESLFAKSFPKRNVIEQLRRSQAVSESVRQKALELVDRFAEEEAKTEPRDTAGPASQPDPKGQSEKTGPSDDVNLAPRLSGARGGCRSGKQRSRLGLQMVGSQTCCQVRVACRRPCCDPPAH
jgi:hypothetical protein